VAKDEKGKPQTVCKDNGRDGFDRHDWHTQHGGEIIGIPQEKINV